MSRKNFPVRIPRYAAGIRAQEPRAGGGRTWWGRRWTAVLEGMGLGARLGRGKNYAVSGQVTELRLEGPHVILLLRNRKEKWYVSQGKNIEIQTRNDD